jgi:hypothetical protein
MASRDGLTSSDIYKNFGNNQIFFEITIESVDIDTLRMYFRDISEIILKQQCYSDELYKDAVLSNYSHE